MKKYLAFCLSLFILLSPLLVFAQAIEIPCGQTGPDCGFDDLVALAANIIDFLIMLSIPLTVVAFIWAGFLMLTAGGNQGQVSKAKGIFWTVFKGFLFVLCAWLIVKTIVTALLKPDAFYPILGA